MIHIRPDEAGFLEDSQWFSRQQDKLYDLVAQRIGYTPDELPEEMYSRITRIIQQGHAAIAFDFHNATVPITAYEDGRIEAEEVTIESQKWAALVETMESPELLNCFIITLGKGFDHLSETLKKNNLFDPYILDAFGSIMIEKAGDQTEALIRSKFTENNLECSRRFSPGYCDWRLKSGQESLCRFLGPEKIGVRCHASGAMTPAKSITAVMVAARQVPWKAPCRFCKEKKCPYRRSA